MREEKDRGFGGNGMGQELTVIEVVKGPTEIHGTALLLSV